MLFSSWLLPFVCSSRSYFHFIVLGICSKNWLFPSWWFSINFLTCSTFRSAKEQISFSWAHTLGLNFLFLICLTFLLILWLLNPFISQRCAFIFFGFPFSHHSLLALLHFHTAFSRWFSIFLCISCFLFFLYWFVGLKISFPRPIPSSPLICL